MGFFIRTDLRDFLERFLLLCFLLRLLASVDTEVVSEDEDESSESDDDDDDEEEDGGEPE